jgi:hypothetical protein
MHDVGRDLSPRSRSRPDISMRVGQRSRRSSLAHRFGVVLFGLVLVATARPVAARRPPADEADPGTVLELDSSEKVVAARLGQALRRALAKRGLDNGRRDSLVELRLAMGCIRDEPACLAKGGEALDVRRLIYGSLRPKGDGHVLELSVLIVDSASVESTVSVALSAADLGEAAIDRTAERIVVDLLKEEAEQPLPPVDPSVAPGTIVDRSVPPPPPPAPSATTGEPEPRKRKLWWGLDRPTPRWKWALFGTSAGLLVVSSITAIALRVAIARTQDKLVRTANESLVDVYPTDDPRAGQPNEQNDVDPALVSDICRAAREHPPDDAANPQSVRNKKVTEVCNVGEGLERGIFTTFGFIGVSMAATLVFAGLIFIHRERNGTTNASTRRPRMSLGPTQRGFGAAISGRF